jgi:hypothetical protein
MRALLYAALFFEDSSDDECDPDLAVKQLEHIAWCASQLTQDEVEEFRAFALSEAERDPMSEIAARIRSLVEGLLPAENE